MIVTIDWQTFQSMFMQQIVFVQELDDSWDFWTTSGLFNVRCTVKKMEDDIENIMFVDRYLNEHKNIVKVISVNTDHETKVPMISREAEGEEYIEEIETTEIIGRTSEDFGHYHEFRVNQNGDGVTTSTSDGEHHVHELDEWEVEDQGGHSHRVIRESEEEVEVDEL